jgi:putative ABC transport system permease protein
LEHKSKSLIIGLIIAVGVLVIVVGNAFLDRAQVGVKDAFTENFTGDVYVYGRVPGKLALPSSILFGQMANGNGQDSETPLLPDFNSLAEYVSKRPGVKASAGLVTAMAMFNVEDKSDPAAAAAKAESGDGADTSILGGAVLMGIEPESYHKMFDNIRIVQGHYLEPGEEGLMLSAKMLSRIKKAAKVELKVGDQLILQGFGSGGFNSRKAPLAAVFESKTESDANQFMAFADVNTVRLLSSLTVGGAAEVAIPESTKALAASTNEDDIFSQDEVVSGGATTQDVSAAVAAAETAPKPKAVADTGAWQYILLKLDNPASTGSTITSLNAYFIKNGIAAVAGDWKGAASPFSQFITQIRSVLGIVILVLAVVAIIIIMNTLVVSVIERTGEIGTMRALGAQKPFVWKMFLIETLCVTLVFGLAGILLSALAMGILDLAAIKASNSLLKILFGGEYLHLTLSAGAVVSTLLMVAAVSFLAHIYPVMVALRIQPVRAMQAE